MHGEKRKNCQETFLQQPTVSFNTIQEIKHGSGGKVKPCLSFELEKNVGSVSNNYSDNSDRVSAENFSDSDDGNTYDSNGNITSKKKKSPLNTKQHEEKILQSVTRPKSKKEPLPMKLRALPQSFWQQPNNTPNQSPGTVCPDLPLLCKEEVADCISTTARVPCTSEESQSTCQKEIVSDANTDLLFSLFRVVEEEQRRAQGQTKVTTLRRGRPKKTTNNSTRGTLKDDDPCLISTVTESLLPLLPERVPRDTLQARINQGRQALAMVSLCGESATLTTVTSPSVNGQNYSHILSEVVIRL